MSLIFNKFTKMPSPHVLRLFVFVGLVWAAVVGPGSVVLILTHMNATSSQIGIVTAAAAVISMVFQPIWGMISDKIGSPRRVICFCLIGSAAFFGAVLLTDNFYVAAILLLMDMLFRCGVVALLDSHTLSEIKALHGVPYGHIRLAGSIFFGTLSLIYSQVIDSYSVMAIIPISVGIAVVTITFGLAAAKGRWEQRGEDSAARRVKPNLRKDTVSLFKNMRFIALIVFAGFSALGLHPLWVFLIEFVTEAGGTTGNVPLIHALRCAVEIPLFIIVGTACKRVDAKKLMIIGTSFMFVYMLGMLFANSLFWIAAAHLVGGTPGFIFGLTGRLRYINQVTPETVRSTSITLMATVEIGFGAILGGLIGGFVLELYGTQVLTLVSLGSLLVAMLVLMAMTLKKRNHATL